MTTTPNLLLNHLEENASSPEVRVNELADGIDYAINSVLTINFASDANLTITATGAVPQQWQNGTIILTDTSVFLTTSRSVIVPDYVRSYRIINNTAQTLTVKTSAGTGIDVLPATGSSLQCDGTNVINLLEGIGSGGGGGFTGFGESIIIPLGNEVDDMTAGTAKVTFRMPYQFVITDVRASLTTAATGANAQFDINEGGVSILSSKLTIDAGETTSTTATAPVVISDANIADDALITIDIDTIGSTIAGAGAKITIIGYKTIQKEILMFAVTDETTEIIAGTGKVTFRMPYAFTLSEVRASLTTAATGASLFTVDINEAGTSILSTKITLDASETTSTTAATAAVISDVDLADDAEITIDIDQAGNVTTGRGLKVYLIGEQV